MIIEPNEIIVHEENLFKRNIESLKIFTENCKYLKVKDKTDIFYLYNQISANEKENDIIVFSGKTITSFLEDNQQLIIARKKRPWKWNSLILTKKNLLSLTIPKVNVLKKSDIEKILGYDSITEGDSVRLFNYLAQSEINIPDEFWPVFLLWLIDETNHFQGFKAVQIRLFGSNRKEDLRIQNELSNFEQFNYLMEDGFKLLVALAYDEAATIQNYNNEMFIYKLIGDKMETFVKNVIKDEGWHFFKFINLIAKYYSERMSELDSILNEVSLLGTNEYKRTFFFDHNLTIENKSNDHKKQNVKLIVKKAIFDNIKKYC